MLTPAIGLATITFSSRDWDNFLSHPSSRPPLPSFHTPQVLLHRLSCFSDWVRCRLGPGEALWRALSSQGLSGGGSFGLLSCPATSLGKQTRNLPRRNDKLQMELGGKWSVGGAGEARGRWET